MVHLSCLSNFYRSEPELSGIATSITVVLVTQLLSIYRLIKMEGGLECSSTLKYMFRENRYLLRLLLCYSLIFLASNSIGLKCFSAKPILCYCYCNIFDPPPYVIYLSMTVPVPLL